MTNSAADAHPLINLKDEQAKEKYKSLAGAFMRAIYLSSSLSYYWGIKGAYAGLDKPIPPETQMKIDDIEEKFPFMKSITSPEEISELFEGDIYSTMLDLAVLLIESAKTGKIEYNVIQDSLAQIVFSEDDTEISTERLEEIIKLAENVYVKEMPKA